MDEIVFLASVIFLFVVSIIMVVVCMIGFTFQIRFFLKTTKNKIIITQTIAFIFMLIAFILFIIFSFI